MFIVALHQHDNAQGRFGCKCARAMLDEEVEAQYLQIGHGAFH